jgi:hypothetical protein
MPCCVGRSRVELGHELCALCESWYTNFHTVHTALHECAQHNQAYTKRSFFYIVCSPDDGHNDARNMLI